MGSDCIEISGLKVDACIGVYEWEQHIRQTLLVDVQLFLPTGALAKVASGDCLAEAIDYVTVAQCIEQQLASRHTQLIETAVEQLAENLLANFPVEGVRIVLRKPAALAQANHVGVTIERYRSGSV